MPYDLMIISAGKSKDEAIKGFKQKVLEQSSFTKLPKLTKRPPNLFGNDELEQIQLYVWKKPNLSSERIKYKQDYIDYVMEYFVENIDTNDEVAIDRIKNDFMKSHTFEVLVDPQYEIWDESPDYFYHLYEEEKRSN